MQRIKDVMCDTIPQEVVVTPTIVDVRISCEEVIVTDEMTGEESIKYKCAFDRYETTEYIDVLRDKNSALETQVTQTQMGLVEVYEMLV